jgi:hypothetical protein
VDEPVYHLRKLGKKLRFTGTVNFPVPPSYRADGQAVLQAILETVLRAEHQVINWGVRSDLISFLTEFTTISGASSVFAPPCNFGNPTLHPIAENAVFADAKYGRRRKSFELCPKILLGGYFRFSSVVLHGR